VEVWLFWVGGGTEYKKGDVQRKEKKYKYQEGTQRLISKDIGGKEAVIGEGGNRLIGVNRSYRRRKRPIPGY